METDPEGNLYIADFSNHRVLLVDANGIVSTLCGIGRPQYSGDGGPATAAGLFGPADVCRDAEGNTYIADYENHKVRKVDPLGIINTFAGTGEPGYSGDDGAAVSARLNHPVSVAVDALGYVYIADRDNHRVRRVDRSGRIQTFAGTGERGYGGDGAPAQYGRLNCPRGLATDTQGNLYIAEEEGGRVRRVDPSGIITTLAGAGKAGFSGDGRRALKARLRMPCWLVVDEAGNVYVSDAHNACVRRVTPEGTITTIAGIGEVSGFLGDGGRADRALLYGPQGLALHGNRLYIADTHNHRIRCVTLSG